MRNDENGEMGTGIEIGFVAIPMGNPDLVPCMERHDGNGFHRGAHPEEAEEGLRPFSFVWMMLDAFRANRKEEGQPWQCLRY